jgi:hypothetical protein
VDSHPVEARVLAAGEELSDFGQGSANRNSQSDAGPGHPASSIISSPMLRPPMLDPPTLHPNHNGGQFHVVVLGHLTAQPAARKSMLSG